MSRVLTIRPILAVAGLLLTGSVFVPGSAPAARSQQCTQLTLHAVQLPDDGGQTRLGYGLTPETASIPGPLIQMTEGDCLEITLFDDIPVETLQELRMDPELPLGVSIHPHGVKYTRTSDGTLQANSYVPPGESRVYRWDAVEGATAGYWWYHDHIVGTEHGTAGQAAGLFGGLIVRRAGDPMPDVPTFVVAFGDNASINLKRDPYTPRFDANVGQRIEFLVFGWGLEHHTFHLHGHNWAPTRTGIPDPDVDLGRVDDVSFGPGDSFGFQVIAGESVGPGRWMYHCHVQVHSDAGMAGMLRVRP